MKYNEIEEKFTVAHPEVDLSTREGWLIAKKFFGPLSEEEEKELTQQNNTDYFFIKKLNDKLYNVINDLVDEYYDGRASNIVSTGARNAYSAVENLRRKLYDVEIDIWNERE